jgi:hypothetical protein
LPKTRTADLLYAYCAVEGSPTALPGTGMPDGSRPRTLPLTDRIAIIVSDVPSATYGAESIESRLSDLDWVGTAGAAHHVVIDAVADTGVVVLPFRLFTLFSSEAAAQRALGERREPMQRAFDRVRGKQEWVLRIGKPDPARMEAEPSPAGSAATGTSFLQAKADARREAAMRATRVKEDAAAAFEALEQLADAARSRPVDASGNLMLDAAFLVPPSRVEALRETLNRRAQRLLRDGCPVSLTGPWPPYSFGSMDPLNG